MANEVIVYEMQWANTAKTIRKVPHKIRTYNIAQVVQLDPRTEVVSLESNSTAFWYKFGGASVSAAANGDDNGLVRADGVVDYEVGLNSGLYLDTAPI